MKLKLHICIEALGDKNKECNVSKNLNSHLPLGPDCSPLVWLSLVTVILVCDCNCKCQCNCRKELFTAHLLNIVSIFRMYYDISGVPSVQL